MTDIVPSDEVGNRCLPTFRTVFSVPPSVGQRFLQVSVDQGGTMFTTETYRTKTSLVRTRRYLVACDTSMTIATGVRLTESRLDTTIVNPSQTKMVSCYTRTVVSSVSTNLVSRTLGTT